MIQYSSCIGFSIIHFNARSLNANLDKIKDYINSLNVSFDVIAISETWLDSSNQNEFNFENYEACHMVRRCKKGGGVAIFVRKALKFKVLPELSSAIDDLFECITLEVILNHKKVL